MGLTTYTSSQATWVDDGNQDGPRWSQKPLSSPRQQPIQRYGGGQIVTYQQTLSPVSVLINTTAEQALTVGTTAGNGILATDFLAAVNKPLTQAGLGVMNGRISAANTLTLTLANNTAANITPTAAQVYNVTVLRNQITNSQTLTPTAVPANMTSEQVFTLAKTDPVITLTIDGAGSLQTAVLVSGGTGLYHQPSAIVTDNAGGIGGVLKLEVSTAGICTGVTIVKKGRGYVSPTVTYVGGSFITEDMFVMVNKPTLDAGVAISNVRAYGNNQIAIQYANPTAAPVTPTSQAYTILGMHDVPPSTHIVSYGMVGTGLSSVASQTSTEQSVTVSGLLATDVLMSIQKPTLIAGLTPGGSRISGANTVSVGLYNSTGAAITPTATEIYFLTVYKQSPIAPFRIFNTVLTPASVAANTSAEQTFTVTGLPFINSSPSTVGINKQSHTPGLAIAGLRVSAADTLAINFQNLTGTAIVPPAENYKIGCFMEVGPLGGVPGSWVADAMDVSTQKANEQSEEHNDFLVTRQFIAGA